MMLYRMLCNDVKQEGAKLRPDLASELFCNIALHNIRYGILNHLDIFKETGGRDIALVKPFFITVSNGKLTIIFTKQVQQPEINGIEILQL